jgi:hypothetical protein
LVWTKMQERSEAHGLYISVGKYVKCMMVKNGDIISSTHLHVSSIWRDFVYSTLSVFLKSLAKTANFYHLPRAFTPVVYIFSSKTFLMKNIFAKIFEKIIFLLTFSQKQIFSQKCSLCFTYC